TDELDGVATFYNLIFRRPVGQHVILLCDSVSCWIMGYERLQTHLRTRLGITLGETTADGQFTLLPIPCLGTCDHAPALMIDDALYRDLDPEKLDLVLEQNAPSGTALPSPQREEARRGEAQERKNTGGTSRPCCTLHPTSPRWGEEVEKR